MNFVGSLKINNFHAYLLFDVILKYYFNSVEKLSVSVDDGFEFIFFCIFT